LEIKAISSRHFHPDLALLQVSPNRLDVVGFRVNLLFQGEHLGA